MLTAPSTPAVFCLETENRSTHHDALGRHVLTRPLHEGIDILMNQPNLESFFVQAPGFAEAHREQVIRKLEDAFEHQFEQAMHEVHASLYLLYSLHTCPPETPRARHQYDPHLTAIRRLMEDHWLACAAQNAPPRTAGHDDVQVTSVIIQMWRAHPASCHPLFDFLACRATHRQMVEFFKSDSALNLRFFDLIALSLVGTQEGARAELVQNLWDESGNGNASNAHVRMFRDLLDSMGCCHDEESLVANLSWEGFAGYNLFMMTATSRMHAFKSLGVMAITELMDPSQYEKVILGCRRLCIQPQTVRYYSEHITVDVVHGQGWLDNVIEPTVRRCAQSATDILLGARMRLDSCARYYDSLLHKLQQVEE